MLKCEELTARLIEENAILAEWTREKLSIAIPNCKTRLEFFERRQIISDFCSYIDSLVSAVIYCRALKSKTKRDIRDMLIKKKRMKEQKKSIFRKLRKKKPRVPVQLEIDYARATLQGIETFTEIINPYLRKIGEELIQWMDILEGGNIMDVVYQLDVRLGTYITTLDYSI